MNYDATKMAEIAEQARHNREQEEAERIKAKAALRTANAKAADTFVGGATGFGKLIGLGLKGKNSPEWAQTGDPELDAAYKQSYVKLDLQTKTLPNGRKVAAPVVLQDYYPMIGKTAGNTVDPEFLAFKTIYNIMRGKNRGATNYSIGDLAGYLLTLTSCVAMLATHERVHKIFSNPDLNVRVTLHDIAASMGLNYASINANLADYATRIARCKSILNELPCPYDFPVLKRWLWLNSFVFRDKAERNSALIIMRPAYWFGLDQTNYRLVCKTHTSTLNTSAPNAGNTYATLTSELDSIEATLGTLMDSTTHQAVAGDILNAFQGHLIDWTAAALGSESPYLYDEEFLLEWTNERIYCSFSLSSTNIRQFDVRYDVNGKFSQGWLINSNGDGFAGIIAAVRDTYLSSGAMGGSEQTIFTDGHESLDDSQTAMAISWITDHDNLVGYSSLTYYGWDLNDLSQTTSHTDTPVTNHKFVRITTYGTELIAPMRVVTIAPTGVISVSIFQDSNECLDARDMVLSNTLDHYPWRYNLDTSTPPVPMLVGTDVDSYATVTYESLRQMHRVKNQALWGYKGCATLRRSMFSVKERSAKSDKGHNHRPSNKDKDGNPQAANK